METFCRIPIIFKEESFIYTGILRMYILRPWNHGGFSGQFTTPEKMFHNMAMSAVRVSVDHFYKDMKQIWLSQDYKLNVQST